MPDVAADAPLAVAREGIGEVERPGEALPAVLGASEQDIPAMRAAREDDFLPKNEHLARVARRERDPRQPRKYRGAARNVDRLAAFRARGREALKEYVLARLVDPDDRDFAPLIDRDRGVVDVVPRGLVHPPGPALGAACRDFSGTVPGKRPRRRRGSGGEHGEREGEEALHSEILLRPYFFRISRP